MDEPSCDTCRFADVVMVDDVDLGDTPHRVCRRNPPQLVALDDSAGTGWPLLHAGDWCGEWSRSVLPVGDTEPGDAK